MEKVALFPKNFIQKNVILDTYFETTPVLLQSMWDVFFFSHKYAWNTMNFTFKKIHRVIFQTTTSLGQLKWIGSLG